jgi:hypothetical protein
MNYKVMMGLVVGAIFSSGYTLVYLMSRSTGDLVLLGVMTTVMGSAISLGICAAISETRWAQKQGALQKPFGSQRVEIMQNQWRLEDLKKRLGDPDERLTKAIAQCSVNLEKLDLAVVTMYQAEIEKVKAQSVEVDLAQENAQKELEKYRLSGRQSDATVKIPSVSVGGRVAQRG